MFTTRYLPCFASTGRCRRLGISLSGLGKMSKLFTFIIFLTFACLATPAESKVSKWDKAMKVLKADSSPMAQKIYIWLNVTQGKDKFTTKQLISFVKDNPDWPRQYKFQELIEEGAKVYLTPHEAVRWFKDNSPRTVDGIHYYLDSLIEEGKHEAAKRYLRKFWITARLSKKETLALEKKYRKLFSPTDHADRLDYLLWERRYREAQRMYGFITIHDKAIARARIALGRLSYNADPLVKKLTPEQLETPGIIYDRAKWRRRMDKDNSAIKMLENQPRNAPHVEQWWRERNILARRKIEDGHYPKAYELVSNHGLSSGTGTYAQAEWLAGWLALEFLNKPGVAYRHFEHFYQSVNSAISRSRAAYWLGRADEAMGKPEPAKNWYKLASYFPSTFYGQLAHEKVYGHASTEQFLDNQASSRAKIAFYGQDLVKAIQLMVKLDLHRYTEPLFKKLLHQADSRADYVLISQLATESGLLQYAVEANKTIQQKLGTFLFIAGYPLLSSIPHTDLEKALIHAIVYRESMFDKKAMSGAGARGLMQLMPGTAREVSRKLRKKYNRRQLTSDPFYNLELGSSYLSQLIERYDGHYPMAIAAYNAGPRNVSRWIKKFGDPREDHINVLTWIEQIPIYETRNYVQRVMETYYIYKLKFSERPQTVLSF